MKNVLFAVLAVGFIALGFLVYSFGPVWEFDHFFDNRAKKAASAVNLQAWATNLVAKYPAGTSFRISQSKTNVPPELLALAPRFGPQVFVFPPDGMNSNGWVGVVWGSGFLGAKGFEIGDSNYVSPDGAKELRQGVYFYER